MSLREDNLGLGAQVGNGNAETFGLSLFSGVLGRLNGKSDSEVRQQQSRLRDAELRTYQAQKYGSMNFVSGGLLVGDRIEPVSRDGIDWEVEQPVELNTVGEIRKAEKRKAENETVDGDGILNPKKKRKREDKVHAVAADQDGGETANATGARKQKKRNRREQVEAPSTASKQTSDVHESLGAGKKPKDKRLRMRSIQGTTGGVESEDHIDEDKSRRKQEKRARKEERRKQKEAKRNSKLEMQSSVNRGPPEEDDRSVKPRTTIQAGSSSRHNVRQRYIQQKRMAAMDPQAMKEIFMLKASA